MNKHSSCHVSNYMEPICYAAEHKSVDVLFSSTTGGLFSAIAEITYAQKGYVGGAIHNDDWSVSHYISNKKEDLKLLRRSKDLQSNAEGFYKTVEALLVEGNKVAVCGVPCQMAALKTFLGKEYENLIIVDLVCLGVNSPKVWGKYIDYIEDKYKSKIVWTENKSKEYGWHNLTQKFVFENGEEAFDTGATSLFTKGYISSHLYCRPSCYNCQFKGFPRVSDITIGDFWGIEKHDASFNKDMGTSLVLINSDRGKEYFDKVKKRVIYKEVPLKWAIDGNPALIKSLSVISDKREQFFKDLDNYCFSEVIERYIVPRKISLRTKLRKIKAELLFWRKVLRVMGYSPKAIYNSVRYSGFNNLIHKKGIIVGKNSILEIADSCNLKFDGLFWFGYKDKFKRSKQESRLFLGTGASLILKGDFVVGDGCDIEIFNDATLTIEGKKYSYSGANIGLTIICGEAITIGADVGIGRNVLIRDTNGNHFMNTVGYKVSKPVLIGEKAWLCESCTIMQGVKIGKGAIIGACSFVTKSVSPHVIVSGNPAEIAQENVLWKC